MQGPVLPHGLRPETAFACGDDFLVRLKAARAQTLPP